MKVWAFQSVTITKPRLVSGNYKKHSKLKLIIPKISLNQLSDKEIQLFYTLNAEKYGKRLSSDVAEKLAKSTSEFEGLYFSHRDYCGIGIFIQKGTFILSTVYDGYGIDSIIAAFNSKSEFIEWLSNESDQSMSLFGEKFNNQTLTRLRLNWYLEDDYSPVWNSYCQYIRDL